MIQSSTAVKPKLSILITTFRRERLLAAGLRSLIKAAQHAHLDPRLGKSNGSIEFLVVVNGPDSATEKIVADILEGFSVQIISLSQRVNPGEARNRAIALASGDWIFFADDDISVCPEFFSSFFEILHRYPKYSVFGGPNLTPPASSKFQRISGAVMGSRFTAFRCADRYRLESERIACSDDSLILCNLFVRQPHAFANPFPAHLVCAEENFLMTSLIHEGAHMISHPKLSVFHERRDSFSGFTKQVFKYGRGRGQLLFNGNGKWFHLVPSISLVTLIFTLLNPSLYFALFAMIASYLCANLVAANRALNRAREAGIFRAALLIATVHVGYGCGVIWGLISSLQIFLSSHAEQLLPILRSPKTTMSDNS